MSAAPSAWLPFTSAPRALRDGRFSLIKAVGSGGHGEVYLADDHERGDQVAIKLLEAPTVGDRGLARRFMAEAVAMAKLRHARIVDVRDGGKEQGWYWFAMEYLPGGSLADSIEAHGPFDPLDALWLVFQTLDALAFIHAHGVIHRDVKPSNLLLDGRGVLKLADFGIARQPDDWRDFGTRSDVTLGTAAYQAPELLEAGHHASPQSDIYAAGATLFHLTTGLSPVRLQYLERDARILAEAPDPIRSIVWTACATEPQQRYRRATRMATAIARMGEKLSPGMGARWLGLCATPPGAWERVMRTLGW